MRLKHAIALAGFVSLASPLTGCDRDGDSGSRSDPILELVGDPSNVPVDGQLEDATCQYLTADVTLTATNVFAWQGEEVESAMMPLTDIRTTKSLVSTAVKATTFGDRYERVCDWSKPSGLECTRANGSEKGWELKDSRGALRVCKDEHAYGRMTYEGVGLAAMSYVSKAHRRYAQLAPEGGAELGQIHLSVLPSFIDFYDNFEVNGEKKRLQTFITHNMAYFPNASSPMIAVFPEEQKYIGKVAGYFWESSFVLGHEYGHHIDSSRHANALTAMGLEWDGAQHGYRDMTELAHRQASMAGGGSARSKVMGSVSEAFADLLAYYAEGGSSLALTGLPCFGQNRDISRAAFTNGDAKILTEDRLGTLMNPPADQDRTCGTPNYTDIHNIGAIVAHAVDQTLAAITAVRSDLEAGSQEDYDARYQMTLAWLDTFTTGAMQADGSDALAMVQPIGVALQKVAEAALDGGFPLVDDGASAGMRNVCRTTAELLPTLTKAPFAESNGSCPE